MELITDSKWKIEYSELTDWKQTSNSDYFRIYFAKLKEKPVYIKELIEDTKKLSNSELESFMKNELLPLK